MQTILNQLIGQVQTSGVSEVNPWIVLVLLIWSLIWKGLALWKAARLSHKGWFIALLIVNVFGILEIIYLYFIARKYTSTVQVARK